MRITPPPTDVTVDTALSLDGTGRLDYALREGPKRDALLRRAPEGATSDPSRLEVKFRTRGKSGTLLHVQESSDYTTVKVPNPKKKGDFEPNRTQNIAKPMFTHSLIPVNTSSEPAPRGNPTPWKSRERLHPFLSDRNARGSTETASGRPDPVWEASLFSERQPLGRSSRLLRLFLIRFLIPGIFPNRPQSSFILSVIPFFTPPPPSSSRMIWFSGPERAAPAPALLGGTDVPEKSPPQLEEKKKKKKAEQLRLD